MGQNPRRGQSPCVQAIVPDNPVEHEIENRFTVVRDNDPVPSAIVEASDRQRNKKGVSSAKLETPGCHIDKCGPTPVNLAQFK